MPLNKHYRNGVLRKKWTCPNHPKEGLRKTIVGKPCPTCGATSGSIAISRLVSQFDWSLPELPEFVKDNTSPERVV